MPHRWALPSRASDASSVYAIARRLGITLAILLCFLPRIGFLARPFESDAGLYAYMGKVVATGGAYGQLYRDFYETKTPGVALFTGVIWRLLGDYWPAWVALQILMVYAAARALRTCATRTWGEGAGITAFWFTLVFLNFGPVAYRGFQLETIVTFFAIMGTRAGWCCITENSHTQASPLPALHFPTHAPFILGFCAGIAAMIKPTGGAVFGAFAITFLAQRKWRAFIPATIGFLLPLLTVFAWTASAGLLPEMPSLWREISLYGSQTPLPITEFLIKSATIAVIAGFTLYAARRLGRGAPITQPATPTPQLFNQISALTLFVLTWLALECFGVYVQKRMYAYHFLPIAAPLALLCARMVAGFTAKPLGLLAAFAPIVALSLLWSRTDLKTLYTTGPAPLPESTYLLTNAAPGDRVVGDGIERLLMETHLRSGTRYAHLFYLANHDLAPAEYGARFLADMESNRPEWAIFESPEIWRQHRQLTIREMPLFAERPIRAQAYLQATDQIQTYIESHYTPQAQLGNKTIWKRR